jgi:hypothetical protein
MVREGLRALCAWPTATGAALVASGTAALATSAGFRRAGILFRRGLDEDSSLLGPALAVGLLALLFGGLLLVLAEAIALSAAATARATGESPLRRGLVRMPAMITLRAVETTVLMMLALGAFAAIGKASALPPAQAALAATLVLAPVTIVGGATIAATRVGVALAARGLAPADALVRGLDVTLRRFPSLVRLALRIFAATLPLTLAAIALALPHSAAPVRHALQAALWAAATLWSYATLSVWVGRDPRLAVG